MTDSLMKDSPKVRITVTLDPDVVAVLVRIKTYRGIKASTYINKILRRHFLRPGKGMDQYTLPKLKGKGAT
ncbi:hypothetical protein CKA38_14525 [Ereboglobus luteus]|uniref:Uncharacterized protein n=1 Tax=Ereboglobus luteus TaxID=1796921 RepID=A0A2U8E654_9BACT|nr:hypothetical protein CKA38_14525 [Ereboglobus luteus]